MGHAGLTNTFHDQDLTPYHVLAKTDPNQANINANEFYHLAITRAVLLDDTTGLLSKARYSEELRAELDSLVETLIVATGPATQSNYLQVLHARLAAEEPLNADCSNQEDRRLVRTVSRNLPTCLYILLACYFISCFKLC